MSAPDMVEVERLVDAFSAACNPVTGGLRHITKFKPLGQHIVESQAARTALLDYVRGVMVERDALIHDNERLMQIVAQEVSAAPQPVGAAEVERLVNEFESAAGPYGHDLIGVCGSRSTTRAALLDYVRGVIAERDQFRDAAKMVSADPQPVGAAEVPMPEINYDGFYLIDRFLRNNLNDDDYAEYMSGLQQYGDAREAAGYAAGLRELLDCRTCRNYTRHSCIQTAQCVDGDGYRRAAPVRFWSAALRGEVKP